MKKNLKGASGITLVALVVTIVVLLILAGITITYVIGDNSIFKKALEAKVNTELAKIEEQAGIIYANKFIEKESGEIDEIVNKDIIDELINNGNKIEIKSMGADNIDGISVEPENVTMDKDQTARIKVNIKRTVDENIYYAVVDGKYYKINFNGSSLTIEREASNIGDDTTEPVRIEVVTGYDTTIVTNIQINETEKIIEITSGTKYGNTAMTVKYGTKTATCGVKVAEAESNWEEIAKIAKEIANDSSITNSTTTATVTVDGVGKTISVGQIYKVKYNEEIRRVRVLGFKHDDLVDTGVYGGNHTKASISFEFYDFIRGATLGLCMNENNRNTGGWAATQMRMALNGYSNGNESQIGAIGGDGAKLSNKDYIKQVTKRYIPTYNQANTSTCDDYLWLLSCSEIFATGYQANAYAGAITKEGERYQFYKGVNPIYNSMNNTELLKGGSSTDAARYWWLRSPYYDNFYSFCSINNDGVCNFDNANTGSIYPAPGFCI